MGCGAPLASLSAESWPLECRQQDAPLFQKSRFTDLLASWALKAQPSCGRGEGVSTPLRADSPRPRAAGSQPGDRGAMGRVRGVPHRGTGLEGGKRWQAEAMQAPEMGQEHGVGVSGSGVGGQRSRGSKCPGAPTWGRPREAVGPCSQACPPSPGVPGSPRGGGAPERFPAAWPKCFSEAGPLAPDSEGVSALPLHTPLSPARAGVGRQGRPRARAGRSRQPGA